MRAPSRIVALASAAVVLVGALAASATIAQADPSSSCQTQLDIRTGYYRSSNAQPSAGIVGFEAITQYRSMADASVWPGYQKAWITALPDSVERSFAIEFKEYGATHGPQTVNGKTVPAAAMHTQKRAGTTFPWAYGYGQMLNGELDPILDRMNAQVKAMVAGRPNMLVNWQIASEFDTDHEFGTDEAGVNYTPAESDLRAVKAIVYMINYLRDHGLPEQVTFTHGMAGIWRDSWLRMHPPSLAWIIDGGLQYNAYNHSTPSRTPYAVFNMTKAWTMADLSPLWKTKPIVMQEWGTPSSQGSQAAWLAQVPAAIARMNSEPGPDVVRMDYFDSNDPWGTFIPRAEGEAAWTAMAADPIFEPCAVVVPSSSPVLTPSAPPSSPTPSTAPSSPEPSSPSPVPSSASPIPSATLPTTPSVQPSASESTEPGGCS